MKRIALLIFLWHVTSFSQVDNQLEKEYSNYKDTIHKGLSYGFFKPKEYSSGKKFPLIIFLHGNKDAKSHHLRWYRDYFQKENPCYVLTPKSLGSPPNKGWGNSIMNDLTDDFKKVMEIIDNTINKHNIDKDRVYIYGVSMGGSGVHIALSEYPNKFAGAYVVSGYGSAEKSAKYSHVPLWIFHGSEDDITPVIFPREIFKEIKKNPNHKTRYTEYNCIGHNSWKNVNEEKNLHEWLFKQVRNKKFKKPKIVRSLSHYIGDRFWKYNIKWESPYYFETDKNKILYYNIYKNGELLAQTDKLEYLDIDTDTTNKSSSYYVTAVDYYSEESKPSEILTINK